jgi:hypothetical protein
MSDIEARVAALERANRRMRRWHVPIILTAALLGALGATRRMADAPLRTQRLLLVDARGNIQAELGPSEGGYTALVLRDGSGAARAMLGVSPDGSPRLSFATRDGASLADLTAYADAAPRLALATPEGHEFFDVSLEADGSSRLALADAMGPRLKLEVTPTGSPSIELSEPGQHGSAELSVHAPASLVDPSREQ